jgi:multisubunit Na+/H+ antiporter MnhB subunit
MQIVGWMVSAIVFGSAIFALFGGKAGVSTTDLNSLSQAILAIWALVYFVLLVVFYRYESNAVAGTFDLIELRKRDRRKWVLKGALAAPAGAAVAWIAGYACLGTINTYLPGPSIRHAAVVASVARYIYTWKCQNIKVRLQNGTEEWICNQRGPFGEIAPANAICAGSGDRAEVAEVSTSLGKSLALLSIDAPSC